MTPATTTEAQQTGTAAQARPKTVLLLGSGALQIGQAGEFDYSGSQALKVLREEGVRSVLVNPNIATIQTSEQLADRVYLAPVTVETVTEIMERENVDAIMLAFGGQTALNCGLELEEKGILAKHGVRVLGTPVKTIRDTEDRKLFVARLDEIGVTTARSIACSTVDEARAAIAKVGLPVMLRGGFALGGKGSGIVETEGEIEAGLKRAFAGRMPQVLVEESLRGWKEIEYEVVRDSADNCLCVCNMENFDPMGIHTGESIVVAPSQTLDDHEYQMLRTIAIKSARHLGIVGECNIQFALDPASRQYRVIEVNARLSRSSALASKATGYPLAYVAARIGLGHLLPDIPNGITRKTTAFFEPALDYIICKVPRWDLTKFGGSVKELGSEMKSVGEVMAIGRTFPEALQKAVRMLDIGVKGVDPHAFKFPDLKRELRFATPRRLFAVAQALYQGMSIEEIHDLTRIDPWFLREVAEIVGGYKRLEAEDHAVSAAPVALRAYKQLGFSDATIDEMTDQPRGTTRAARLAAGIRPHLAQIDTTAAEFPAVTNYMYSTYHASQSEAPVSDRKKVVILGSGAYRIGSSVEFDWCGVNAAQAASAAGFETIMLNFNPETVSTDWDVCDQLVFDEISLESVLELCDREQPFGVVVSMGGQIPNNLAARLAQAGVPILGTSAANIDRAEDRSKFSALLDARSIAQPRWEALTDQSKASEIVDRVGGFPVLVRPSYVLSGAAMSVAHEIHELESILARAKRISPEHPVVVSKFELHAREIEIDAVADKGQLVLWAVSEHVENAGVHSGDATLVLPPQSLYLPTIRRARDIAVELASALEITGPFNVQFIAKHNLVKVIECNLRASRSFPFVSKVLGVNFAEEAMRRMLGLGGSATVSPLELDYVGVKVPMFSFGRLVGADPILGVEMMSTGEVGCIAETMHEALMLGLTSTGFRVPKRGVLLSLGPKAEKFGFADQALVIRDELKLPIYATAGTAEMLRDIGVDCHVVGKTENDPESAVAAIEQGAVDLVINIPATYDAEGRPDGYRIRRAAIDAGVPLFTDPHMAQTVIEVLERMGGKRPRLRAMTDFAERRH